MEKSQIEETPDNQSTQEDVKPDINVLNQQVKRNLEQELNREVAEIAGRKILKCVLNFFLPS